MYVISRNVDPRPPTFLFLFQTHHNHIYATVNKVSDRQMVDSVISIGQLSAECITGLKCCKIRYNCDM